MNGFDLLHDDNALDLLTPDYDMTFIGEGKHAKRTIPHDATKSKERKRIQKNTNKQRLQRIK